MPEIEEGSSKGIRRSALPTTGRARPRPATQRQEAARVDGVRAEERGAGLRVQDDGEVIGAMDSPRAHVAGRGEYEAKRRHVSQRA